jgi:predicted lactoylglutathione lyase
MELGAFSVSLAVKDLAVSKAFYEKLGFSMMAGDMSHNYLIMKNGDHLIGLFQGMFEQNILTFNPGWTQSAGSVDGFTDVRKIRESLVADGVKILQDNTSENDAGPAHITFEDPDGNAILIDQHV